MPIAPLTCPACGAAVNPASAPPGQSAVCGTCGGRVAVPAAVVAPVVTARAVPTAPPVPVTAEVVDAQVVSAAPAVRVVPAAVVPAKPATATPAAPVPAVAVATPRPAVPVAAAAPAAPATSDGPRWKSRRDSRRDDDEDDDRPARRSARGSGGGATVLIAVLGVGALVLVGGFVVLLVAVMRPGGPGGMVAVQPDGANGPLVFTNITPSSEQAPEPTWTKVGIGDGYEVELPNAERPWANTRHGVGERTGQTDQLGRTVSLTAVGTVTKGSDGSGYLKYSAAHYDLPPGFTTPIPDILPKMAGWYSFPKNGRLDPQPASVGGKSAFEVTFRDTIAQHVIRYCRVGDRLFVFDVREADANRVISDRPRRPDADRQRITARFWDSIRLTHDPATVTPTGSKAAWRPIANAEGFRAETPGSAYKTSTVIHVNGSVCRGQQYQCDRDPSGGSYVVAAVDLPDDVTAGTDELVKSYCGADELSGPTPTEVGGRPAVEYVRSARYGLPLRSTVRAVLVGYRLFVFQMSYRVPQEIVPGTLSRDELAARFFGSLSVTFDPATAPPRPAGRPRPSFPVPSVRFPAPGGQPATVTRVEPFLAAVPLPAGGGVLTFAVRDTGGARPSGVARRYSLPEFKLQATYRLPAAVTQAAIDEAGGRLVVAAVTRPDPQAAADPAERAVAFAEVETFDLKALTGPPPADRADELKPTGTLAFGTAARVAGLELTADGKTGYALTTFQTGTGTKRTWKSRVVRFDPVTAKAGDAIDLPGPAWQLKLTADGRHLYAADQYLTAAGVPTAPPVRQGMLAVIDTAAWKVIGSARLAGPVVDLIAGDGDKVLAAASAASGVRLYAADPDGVVTDLTPADWIGSTVGTVARAGGRLVSSARGGGAGVSVYDAKTLTAAGSARPTAVTRDAGGRFVLTPDGRYGVFQTGAVLDFGASR